jgi:Eukaryotic aspartyl protease
LGFNVSIGQPPQPVTIALSIESPFVLVQSAGCTSYNCYGHPGFNASVSSSFQRTENRFRAQFGWLDWKGFYATDDVELSGLTLESLPLLFADYIGNGGIISWYFGYDGALGLSPDSSLLIALKAAENFEKNVFGIKYPSGHPDLDYQSELNDGELTLGGISPEFEDAQFINFPLANGNKATSWATKVSKITYQNRTHHIEKDLSSDSIAAFTSANPFIAVPWDIAQHLLYQVMENTTGVFFGFPSIDCDLRVNMASLTLHLGEGDMARDITLSPYEYTIKVSRGSIGAETCVVVTPGSESNTIQLGWPFMRKFYSVFDYDEKMIRCEPQLQYFSMSEF